MITVIPESQGVKSNSDKFQRVKVSLSLVRPKKKYVCLRSPDPPYFSAGQPTLNFFIGNYSTIIFASDPINFYTEFR